MADEDFEKKMEFIIEQQAQFAVNQDKADERLARLENLVTRFAQATVERINDFDEKFAALVDVQMRTEESIKKTEESLRNLMAVVDRYFSEGRNGKPQE
jgi:ABC-type transporter Mla subunit MlaD